MTNKPPLSIAHLLLWTAMSGAVMAILRLQQPSDFGPRLMQLTQLIQLSIISMYGGAVTASLVIWFARRVRGIRFPVEAGEWLLVEQGLLMLLVLVQSFFTWDQTAVIGILGAVGLGVGLLPVIFYRGDSTWLTFFIVLAMLLAIPLLLMTPFGIALAPLLFNMGAMGLLILYIAAVIDDRRHRRNAQRGWLNWLGVYLPVAFFPALAVTALFMSFAPC